MNRSFYRKRTVWKYVTVVLLSLCLLSVSAYAGDGTTYGTPFYIHGKLTVSGAVLIDSTGEVFQPRGITIMDFVKNPQYLNEDDMKTLRDSWGVTTIRLCLGQEEYEAYSQGDTMAVETIRTTLIEAADTAASLGLYLIIHWYTPETFVADTEREAAKSFFADLLSYLGTRDSVLYEIGGGSAASWEETRTYAPEVIDTIRAYSPTSVVIVDIPGSLTTVDFSQTQPVDRSNLLYGVSIDADLEQDYMRIKLETAASSGMPLIISKITAVCDEYTRESISGNAWLSLFDSFHIGCFIGPLYATDSESNGLLYVSENGLADYNMTAAATWYVSWLQSESVTLSMAFYPTESGEETIDLAIANGCTVNLHLIPGTYNGLASCEYDITITNNTGADLPGWNLSMSWTDTVSPVDYWNCYVTSSGASCALNPMDFNSYIANGSSISLGIIVYGNTVELAGVY